MPSKSGFPPLPYLDPQFNPEHPANQPFEIREDPYLPMTQREKTRLKREHLEQALATYEPPHVIRAWESDKYRHGIRTRILAMTLPDRRRYAYEDLVPNNPRDSSKTRLMNKVNFAESTEGLDTDFRRFAAGELHLGYHRIRASYGDIAVPFDQWEDGDILPEDVCWIMEYTYSESNGIRRQLAHLIGEFPAVTEPDNDLYNDELAWRYDRRLLCRCRRKTRNCIRPSHIEIFTATGEILP